MAREKKPASVGNFTHIHTYTKRETVSVGVISLVFVRKLFCAV